MACFLVPAAEAVVVTAVEKFTKDRKQTETSHKGEISPLRKSISRLKTMLWGGSALLAFEHIWHGEVTPWFPFLTNAANPADRAEMFREMGTSGVGMAVLVTLFWGVTALVSARLERKTVRDGEEK